MTWDFLASTVLDSSNSTIDSGTIEEKKNLYVQVFGIPDGNLDACVIRFNGDTDPNYSLYKQNDGTTASSNTDENGINYMSANTTTDSHFADFQIMNIDGKPKILIDRTVRCASGANNAPNRKVMVGKWTGTDPITQIEIVNRDGTGDYAANSYLNIFGSD
jgi:hypothetical protein